MTYFFLDFENANQLGKNVNPDVVRGDEIHVFYSEQNKRISLEFLDEMVRRGVSVLLHRVSGGRKNSLDFQLTTYLGYKIGQQGRKPADYVIISADTDYDKVIDFWEENGQTVERCATLMSKVQSKKEKARDKTKTKDKPKEKPKVIKAVVRSKPKKEEEPALSRKVIADCLPNSSRAEVTQIMDIVTRDGVTKHDVSNELNKMMKSTKKGGAIYQKIKPLLQKVGIR